jgi:hypothetical protein
MIGTDKCANQQKDALTAIIACRAHDERFEKLVGYV